MPYNPFIEEDLDVDVLLEEEVTDDTSSGELAQLIVYNDEVNTFDWVVKCFTDVLKHSVEQAEQLSIIIHTKGKATVKTAPFKELRPKKDALVEKGLSAVIEEGN
ncbi:MAG: ATP-dependent Clp protease adaptor ClpS [Lewinellaceae bacterium]|nr:ATP-dependent Clp protease adaptor ClpS [Saprospiraceae bacterium]MCB9336536.1 ATP-dependent Clp protease adaptor ClpS [Lewinellaceae bacterium]